jgi:hypothetical protein
MVFPFCVISSVFARRAFWLIVLASFAGALPYASAKNCSGGEPASCPPAAAPPAKAKDFKQLLEEFRQAYALPDDKVIKRVGPPFSAGRLEFYRVHDPRQAKLICEGPGYFWFKWDEPKPDPHCVDGYRWREGRLGMAGLGCVGGKGVELCTLVDYFTGIHRYEMLGDRKLLDAKVAGDWVIRYGAPPEKLLPEMEAILRRECKLPVRLRLVREDRKVIVAEGNYVYRPLPGLGTVTYKEGSEENNWLEGDYDELEVFANDRNDLWQEAWYDLDTLLKRLNYSIDRPVLNEVSRPPKNSLIVCATFTPVEGRPKQGKLDEAAILKHLSEQTGLTFSEKTRRVRVLLVERAE